MPRNDPGQHVPGHQSVRWSPVNPITTDLTDSATKAGAWRRLVRLQVTVSRPSQPAHQTRNTRRAPEARKLKRPFQPSSRDEDDGGTGEEGEPQRRGRDRHQNGDESHRLAEPLRFAPGRSGPPARPGSKPCNPIWKAQSRSLVGGAEEEDRDRCDCRCPLAHPLANPRVEGNHAQQGRRRDWRSEATPRTGFRTGCRRSGRPPPAE